MLEEMLKNVREKSPLIHNITNYVTVNDCANVSCMWSFTTMADDQKEVLLRFVQDLILILEHLIERLNQWSLLGKANELHHLFSCRSWAIKN